MNNDIPTDRTDSELTRNDKMVSIPTPEPNKFIELGKYLAKRRSRVKVRYGVFAYGYLQNIEEYRGQPCYGIQFFIDVFNTLTEAEDCVEEVMNETGYPHLRIMMVGQDGLLSLGVDPKQSCTMISSETQDTIKQVDRDNVIRSRQEQIARMERNSIIEQEQAELDDQRSTIYYANVWLRYIQNRKIRENVEVEAQKYRELELARRNELIQLQHVYPEHEQNWVNDYLTYRKLLGEEVEAKQLISEWNKYKSLDN